MGINWNILPKSCAVTQIAFVAVAPPDLELLGQDLQGLLPAVAAQLISGSQEHNWSECLTKSRCLISVGAALNDNYGKLISGI